MNIHKFAFFIYTMGCQMNANESDLLSTSLINYGLFQAQSISKANVVIINTCSVREHAEQKAFSYFGRLIKHKKYKIVIIGCMAKHLHRKLKLRFNSIDLIIWEDNYNDMKHIASKIVNLLYKSKPIYIQTEHIKSSIIRYIAITKGCNNYCSYCIVPFVRGKEVSFNYQEILDKCISMAQNGAREVILLGQNVNSYSNNGITFTDLLKKISIIENILRIRFMTNHPKDLSDELIQTMVSTPKICPHIHLPMQSASNKILYQMNRKYSYEQYIELINKLRIAIPSISITTDIIVGFPNETEEDFNQTLNAVRQIQFSKVYVFKYSQRPYTSASKMQDNISSLEKQRRHQIILNESRKISLALVARMIGSIQKVLIKQICNYSVEAITPHGYKIFITNNQPNVYYIGQIVNVKITSIKEMSLFGTKILN
jgi:tRNA-2-methylthio-N6-dimethylallyladenosine synthase